MRGEDDYREIIENGKKFVFNRYSKQRFHHRMQKMFFPQS